MSKFSIYGFPQRAAIDGFLQVGLNAPDPSIPDLPLEPLTLTPSTGALALDGAAALRIAGFVQKPLVGALALAGLAPTVTVTGSSNTTRTPVVGTLAIAGAAPTIRRDTIIVTGALTNLGNTAPLDIPSSGDDGFIVAGLKITVGAHQVIESLSMVLPNAAGNIRMGLYADDGAGTPIGQSLIAETASAVAKVGTNTLPVLTQTIVPPGDYWIAYQQSTSIVWTQHNGSPGPPWPSYYYTATYGAFDATFDATPAQDQATYPIFATFREYAALALAGAAPSVNRSAILQPSTGALSTTHPESIGALTNLSGDDSGDNGFNIAGRKITVPAGHVLQSITIRLPTAAGNIRLALYASDGGGGAGYPGTLLAQSASVAAVTGLNTLSMTAPYTIPTTGIYWLAFQVSSGSAHISYETTSGVQIVYYAMSYGAFDSTFSPSGLTTNNTPYQLYATFDAGIAPVIIRGAVQQPSVGALALSGIAPTVTGSAGITRQPNAGALVIAGAAPTLIRGSVLTPVAGALVLAGLAPTIARSVTLQPSTGALTLTGIAPTLIRGSILRPVAGALVLAGLAPTIARSTTIAPSAGALALSGKQATVTSTDAHTIAPSVGALVIDGLQPNVASGANVIRIPSVGTLLLDGAAPIVSFTDAHTSQPSVGALTLDGQAPILARSTTIVPTVGALTLGGNQATVSYTDAHTITPAVATLIIDGQQPDIQAGANVVRTPSSDTLLLGGVAPIVTTTDFETIQPTVGALVLDGQSAVVSASDHRTFAPSAGALLLGGIAPIVIQTDAHTVVTSTGALALDGQAASVVQGTRLDTAAGALVISGAAPTLSFQSIIVPATGALQFVGSAAELIESGNIHITPTAGVLALLGRRPIINGAGGGDIKTIYGVDIGDVSSINETAKVDVKTYLGLTP